MKTTLVLDDKLVKRLKEEAARQGTTMSELTEAALRLMLDPPHRATRRKLPPLPKLKGSRPTVDVADRDELYRVMEGL